MACRLTRLKRRADFLRVAGARAKWVAPGLIVQAAPSLSPDDDTIALGFTCSKRVGNAVARNRAKRRLRAAADTVISKLGSPAFDYVLIGRPETVDYPFDQLLEDLEKAIERASRKVKP